jgi:hypothetical protein
MKDADFLRALKSCELPEQEFGHAGHVRAAYLCLRAADFAGALQRVSRAIRAYATYQGKPERYHETMTVAYVALIQQHMVERGDGGDWATFARDNADFLDKGLLEQFYTAELLKSDTARKIFVLPR